VQAAGACKKEREEEREREREREREGEYFINRKSSKGTGNTTMGGKGDQAKYHQTREEKGRRRGQQKGSCGGVRGGYNVLV
jgi:hypothetical protein